MKSKPPSKNATEMAYYVLSPDREIRLPDSINEISNSQFYGSEMEGHLVIPPTVERIGSYAFCYCPKIKSVTIPNSVKDIGIRAFAHCDSLERVTIGDEVEMIWNHAFEDCVSLKEIRLPKSLIEIGHGMFRNCQSLTTVWITNKNTVINDVPVNQRKAIKNRIIQNPIKEFSDNLDDREWIYRMRIAYHELEQMTIFKDCKALKRIFVPKGSLDYYSNSIPRLLNYLLVESED